MGGNLQDLKLGKILRLDTETRSIKRKIDKLDINKVKKFCSAKDPVKGTKSYTLEKDICTHISDRGLVCRIYFLKTLRIQQYKSKQSYSNMGKRCEETFY